MLLLSLVFAAGLSPVSAQLRDETTPVLVPVASVAAPDDAHAVSQNPAALPFLEGASLVYVHAEALGDDTQYTPRGDAIRGAVPLPFGLAAGLAFESVRPTDATGLAHRGAGTLALGWAPMQSLSFGASLRWFGSSDRALNGLVTFDLAAMWRPGSTLALSLLARDVTGPIFASPGSPAEDASFLLALALRPFGTRTLTFDLAASLDTEATVGLRGGLELTIPYAGRLSGAVEVTDLDSGEPGYTGWAGLMVDWDWAGVGGGAIYGDGFDGAPGFYASARLEAFAREGIPPGSYVLDLPVRSGLGERGILGFVWQLDRALHDDRIAGVYIRFRGSGIGSAYAEEIRQMIGLLREADKRVVCHLDDGSGAEFYACASANATYVDPAGGVRLQGPSGEALLFGEILRNVGLRTDFLRIGSYKSAAEQFTVSRRTEPSRAQRDLFYDDVYDRLVHDLAADLGRTTDEVRGVIDRGPYQTFEATEANLVTGAADELEMNEELEEALGGSYSRRDAFPTRARARWREDYVGVVVVDGDIVDGENVDIPLIGIKMSGGRTIVDTIESLAGDPRCAVIVLRVDSPGGSALASDQIWRAVMRARRRKPVIASMGAVAASGGYYVSAAAQEIRADPVTITGSIGIFFGKVDVIPLAENIGVGIESFGRGRHAGLESFYRPFTPDERLLLADKLRIWYRLFLRRVAEGRDMEIADIDAIARGRIWSGDAALRLGLVDHLGGFGAVLARARELGGLPTDAQVMLVPWRPSSLLDYVIGPIFAGAEELEGGVSGLDPQALASLPPDALAALRIVMALAHTSDGVPSARLDAVVSAP
jgi:protease-4